MAKKIRHRIVAAIKGFRLTRSVFSYPYILFLLLFVVTPLVLILVNAFIVEDKLSLGNFIDLVTDGASLPTLFTSLMVGIITTIICLLVGYPVAYILSKRSSGKIIVLLFILPMWVNFLIRTLATRAIFEALKIDLGIGTVIFGMVYNFLPFMILPLHTTLSNIDKSFSEAAQDLGADPPTVFLKTVLPLSLPGIISGITMVFIPTVSTFAISQLLGGTYLFGDSIYNKFNNGMYGVGSVMSLIMLLFVIVSNMFIGKANKGEVARNLW
ncbi:MAG: ABC transporter permease [Clostridia bacterium]|nr:ABC transporter permease [Clostridia bacterium]